MKINFEFTDKNENYFILKREEFKNVFVSILELKFKFIHSLIIQVEIQKL